MLISIIIISGMVPVYQLSMMCIELIRLRTRPDRDRQAAEWMLKTARALSGTPCLRKATVYARISVPADLSLHLEWEDPPALFQESEEALHIAEELKVFGLIDHTVWVPRERDCKAQPSGNDFERLEKSSA
jgi:hypothetical protein